MTTTEIRARDEIEAAGSTTPAWHTMAAAAVADRLGTAPQTGLSQAEAQRHRAESGPNRLREPEEESVWEAFLEELREPMVLLLLGTGLLYALWGELSDAVTIFFVILTMAGIEFYNERRASKAMAALRSMAEPTALVRREGTVSEIAVDEVVPGDIVLLQAGRRVPADGRLLESFGLTVDESALTGESVPVAKEAQLTLSPDVALAERQNLVFTGTLVTRGRGSAVVVATGMASELGRVAELAGGVEAPRTPLQVAMRQLSGSLVWLALAFSVLVPLLAWLFTDLPLPQVLLTGLSLAFATIPEEMPIIITLVLALGAYRLSRRRAVVKELQAVETLGAVSVIATDKTGTLTENQMQVRVYYPEARARRLLEVGVLASDIVENGGVGSDPLERALLQAAQEAGLDGAALRRAAPLQEEFTFDNARKRMSAVYARADGYWVAAKGAAEAILERSRWQQAETGQARLTAADRDLVLAQATRMAESGLRVIACAEKITAARPRAQEEAESDLNFVGLVGLADPPRPEVKEAITACHSAGIRPIMITGDHPATARAIAAQVGLDGKGEVLTGPQLEALSDEALRTVVGQVSLYARTTPEHKLRLVRALQARGARVAVTGDGINDAPALSAADIGVAMGETGTDVAREAAAIVLTDDNFATIVAAVHEGRVLFANLRKGVRYYLAVKVALIGVTLLPALLGMPVPFSPIQIILLELFMDLAAAATFVVEPGEADLMQRPPRDPQARFLDQAMAISIVSGAAGLFAAVAAVYLVAWSNGADVKQAQTLAFVTWLLGHVALAFHMRSERQPLLRLGLLSNRLMVLWAAATVAFVVVITHVPWMGAVFKTVPLRGEGWAWAVSAALVGTVWMEIRKWVLSGDEHEMGKSRADGSWRAGSR